MNTVKVDYLAFSFSLSYLRDLSRWYEYSPTSGYTGTLPAMPLPPENICAKTGLAVAVDKYMSEQQYYQQALSEAIFSRLRLLVDRSFGLSVGPLRSRGMQGYQHSCRLFSPDGAHECGYLMFGGNNDTVHMQISGTGCRYLFAVIAPSVLHNVLVGLGVSRLSRTDFALDDFTGNFGCDYARIAYYDRAFRCAARGKYPRIRCIHDSDIDGKMFGHTIYVGSRKSRVFWRVYDKSLERQLDGVTWYRSEVELKDVPVAVLSDVDAYFAGICDYSASLLSCHIETVKRLPATEKAKRENLLPCLDILSRVRRVRRQVGKVTGDVLDAFQGDLGAAFGLLMRQEQAEKYRLCEYKNILHKGEVIFSRPVYGVLSSEECK